MGGEERKSKSSRTCGSRWKLCKKRESARREKENKWSKGCRLSRPIGRPTSSLFPSKRWQTSLKSLLSVFLVLSGTAYAMGHPCGPGRVPTQLADGAGLGCVSTARRRQKPPRHQRRLGHKPKTQRPGTAVTKSNPVPATASTPDNSLDSQPVYGKAWENLTTLVQPAGGKRETAADARYRSGIAIKDYWSTNFRKPIEWDFNR